MTTLLIVFTLYIFSITLYDGTGRMSILQPLKFCENTFTKSPLKQLKT